MTYKDDLLRLKTAQIEALELELERLRFEIQRLQANLDVKDNLITEIYNENKQN